MSASGSSRRWARFLTGCNLQSRREKRTEIFVSLPYKRNRIHVHICHIYTVRRSLMNAHVLPCDNYHIKVSLLIPNTVLIATLDNLLNCSIMRSCSSLSPSFTSLEALRIHTRSPRCDFVGCRANRTHCTHCLWKSQQDIVMCLISHILKDDYYADDCAVLHIILVGWVVTFQRTRCYRLTLYHQWVYVCVWVRVKRLR